MKQKIFLISGFKRAGKDFIAEYMNDKLVGSNIISFAKPMKIILAKTLGITLEEVELFKNEPEGYGVEVKAYPNNQNQVVIKYTNLREMLQLFGTEAMKPLFGDNVWAELAENRARRMGGTIIIPDFRFTCETDVWDEELYDVIEVRIQDDKIASTDMHASETELNTHTFDYYINNTEKNESVFESVDVMLEEVMAEQSNK